MIRVYHTGVTNPSSTDTTSTTASTATDSVICWTCFGLTVNIAGEYIMTIFCICTVCQEILNGFIFKNFKHF